MGMAFPLFTRQLYEKLNFRWGGTLIACIAAVLAPIPIILLYFGKSIRARSKFASGIVSTEVAHQNETELAGKGDLVAQLASEANV